MINKDQPINEQNKLNKLLYQMSSYTIYDITLKFINI